MGTKMSSRQSGSSRYPSAYGHTPSYKSYSTVGSDGRISDSITLTSGIDLGPSGSYSGVSAFNRNPGSTLLATSDFSMPSTLGTSGGATSSASKKVSSYSSSYSSSSTSGVPHTSYSHTTSGFSSENPYKNRTSTYSYNI